MHKAATSGSSSNKKVKNETNAAQTQQESVNNQRNNRAKRGKKSERGGGHADREVARAASEPKVTVSQAGNVAASMTTSQSASATSLHPPAPTGSGAATSGKKRKSDVANLGVGGSYPILLILEAISWNFRNIVMGNVLKNCKHFCWNLAFSKYVQFVGGMKG